MTSNQVVCRYCGYQHFLQPREEPPNECPKCEVTNSVMALWWMAPFVETPVKVPCGVIDPHPYTLTKADWLLLFQYAIAPEISYDEAQ